MKFLNCQKTYTNIEIMSYRLVVHVCQHRIVPLEMNFHSCTFRNKKIIDFTKQKITYIHRNNKRCKNRKAQDTKI